MSPTRTVANAIVDDLKAQGFDIVRHDDLVMLRADRLALVEAVKALLDPGATDAIREMARALVDELEAHDGR